MGYFGFMGLNNNMGYGNYGYPFLGSPSADKAKAGYAHSAQAENNEGGSGEKSTGFAGFFQGLKNGFVNTLNGIFSIKGALMTAATVGLVMATGGAALIPLAILGTGLGGYKIVKGIKKGDTEQMGEGVFMVGVSLGGLKLAPKTVGTETLADSSMLGKFAAPFSGKGTFLNPNATFWSASKAATGAALRNLKLKLIGGSAVAGGAAGEAAQEQAGLIPALRDRLQETVDKSKSGVYRDRLREWWSQDGTTATAENTQATAAPGQSATTTPGATNKSNLGENVKNLVASTPANPQPNGTTNPQGAAHGVTQVSFSDRAKNYLDSAKGSTLAASTLIGSNLSGDKTSEKKGEKAENPAGIEGFYY